MDSNILFTPAKVGRIELNNRVVMAPMTRGRANADGTPNDLMAEYYEQRASAGLIITEATAVSRTGYGWVNAPGIFNKSHVEGWRNVTNAVHRNGGRIYLQLWHMGRVSHPDFLGGALPVGPSPIAARGDAFTLNGKKTIRHAARARCGGNSLRDPGIRACRAARARSVVRRRGDSRREWLSDRSIPARWFE
jgi:2,4-dienoyl-CoA reductase-like NADH-dependent reductase (Old Yellow Enzyme family)